MTAINRVPRGLQSLLDTKSKGVNPSDLGQVISPIVDLGNLFYADLILRTATANQINPGVGAFAAPVAVPAGETWAVRSWGFTVIRTGGTGIAAIHGALLVPLGALVHPVTDDLSRNLTAVNNSLTVGKVFTDPVLVSNGASVGCVLGEIAGAGHTVVTSVAYYRLRT